jgi:catechol 2,3-dioxygenase-like lactoylglutathione lyase family enzyme
VRQGQDGDKAQLDLVFPSEKPEIMVNVSRPMEVKMSSTQASSASVQVPDAGTVDMKLEVVTLPVSDVDRAKDFYQSLGWRLDADIASGDAFRVVQLTPPHSACSVSFGTGVTTGEPGSIHRLILAVDDIDAARAELVRRGAQVSELFHLAGGRVPGRDPENRSYQTYAAFSDPDGNEWLLQEIKTRLPGREWKD